MANTDLERQQMAEMAERIQKDDTIIANSKHKLVSGRQLRAVILTSLMNMKQLLPGWRLKLKNT